MVYLEHSNWIRCRPMFYHESGQRDAILFRQSLVPQDNATSIVDYSRQENHMKVENQTVDSLHIDDNGGEDADVDDKGDKENVEDEYCRYENRPEAVVVGQFVH